MYTLRMCCVVLLTLFIGSGNALAKRSESDESSVSAITLDVLRVEACIDHTDECFIAGGLMRINLLDLAEGRVDFARQVLLPENTAELRLVLGDNNTITVDDEALPLDVPSGRTSELRLKGEDVFPPERGLITSMTLDFDLGRALVVRGKTSGSSYALKPVIPLKTVEIIPLPEGKATSWQCLIKRAR